MVSDQYKHHKLYECWTESALRIWENKHRLEYEADVWYNEERNRISLEMIGDLAQGMLVLDMGASLWVEAEFLSNLNCRRYIRTDIIQTEGIEILADACILPFADESFGMVVCRELIEHVLDASALLSEAYRVLKKDGYLFVTAPNGYDVLPDKVIHLRAFTPRKLISDFERFSFKVIDKRGNVPNLFYSLIPLAREGHGYVLPEFKEIAEKVDAFKDSYYIGTQLFILAKKN